MTRFAIFFLASLMCGCWAAEVDRAARTTQLIDDQFAVMYTKANDMCVATHDTWEGYDACMDPWKKDAATIARLREVTLTLDVAKGRKAKKAAACLWFKTVAQTHLLIPARQVALKSSWRHSC